MKVTRRQLKNIFRKALLDESSRISMLDKHAQRNTDAELLDDADNTHSKFIDQLHEAVVDKSGSTGFGFIFERIVITPAVSAVLGLNNPEVLNLSEGDTNLEFADIISDGDVYYSVKCSIWEGGNPKTGALITEVNSSKPSSLAKLARRLEARGDLTADADGNVKLKVGVVAGHPSGEYSRGAGMKGLGMKVEVFKPNYENIIVRKDSSGKDIVSRINELGDIIFTSYPLMSSKYKNPTDKQQAALQKRRDKYFKGRQAQLFTQDVQTSGATSVSAFQKSFYDDSPDSKVGYFILYPHRSEKYKLKTTTEVQQQIAEITVDSALSAALRATGKSSEKTAAERKAELQGIATGDYSRALSRTKQEFGDDSKVTKAMGIFSRGSRDLASIRRERNENVANINPDQVDEVSDLCEIISDKVSIGSNAEKEVLELLSKLNPKLYGAVVKGLKSERFNRSLTDVSLSLDTAISGLLSAYPDQEALDYVIDELRKALQSIENLDTEKAASVNESLSRGSLIRRRYGRY